MIIMVIFESNSHFNFNEKQYETISYLLIFNTINIGIIAMVYEFFLVRSILYVPGSIQNSANGLLPTN